MAWFDAGVRAVAASRPAKTVRALTWGRALGAMAAAGLTLAGAGAAAAHETPTGPALTLVEEALDRLGVGRDVRSLATMRTEMRAVAFDLVENDHPDAPFPIQDFPAGTVIDDYAGRTQVTLSKSPTGGERRLVLKPVAQISNTVGQPYAAAPPPPSWETEDPLRALLLARAAPDLTREPDAARHGAMQHVVAFHNGRFPVRIFIDTMTGLPTATEVRIVVTDGVAGSVAWNAWGDVVERSEFMLYDLADGVRYPQQIDVFRNGAHLRAVQRSNPRFDDPQDRRLAEISEGPAAKNLDLDHLAVGQPVGGPPGPARTPHEIAPGIIQLPGSWYATLVRQADGVVVLDAPIAPGYSQAVLAEAARRFPGAKVKAVVVSTGFFWHVAGVREYAALGVPIYVRDRNVPILRALLVAPHTLRPDTLARRRTPVDLRAVSAPITIGKGVNAITVMPVRYGEQPMVMSWLPDARILHTAEMVQPLGPGGSLLFPEALHEITLSVAEAGIPTDGLRIIGMHMSPTPWTAVAAALGPATHQPASAS
ncbi:MAG TPA: MBL fold metallo-hydrolase [Phenylobacterium sp.]|nr:MBL fold metallo-hydrolase [Phenylobacterium sp.]